MYFCEQLRKMIRFSILLTIFSTFASGKYVRDEQSGSDVWVDDDRVIRSRTQKEIDAYPLVVYGKGNCRYSKYAPEVLDIAGYVRNKHYKYHEFDEDVAGKAYRDVVSDLANGWSTVPMVFVCGRFLGGADDLKAAATAGTLHTSLKSCESEYKWLKFPEYWP